MSDIQSDVLIAIFSFSAMLWWLQVLNFVNFDEPMIKHEKKLHSGNETSTVKCKHACLCSKYTDAVALGIL